MGDLRWLWHQLAKQQWAARPGYLDRPSWNGWDTLTNPGCVGNQFAGTVFLALNPGNGEDSGPSAEEARFFGYLEQLPRDPSVFDSYNTAYFDGLKVWNIGRYMREINARWEEIAFINLVPWRTGGDLKSGEWTQLARFGWKLVQRQFDLLQPKTIVILGKTTYDLLPEEMRSKIGTHRIFKRARGDNHTPEETKAKMVALKIKLGW